MTDNPTEVVESVEPSPAPLAGWRRFAVVLAIMVLLFAVPTWTLFVGADWPVPVVVAGVLVLAAALLILPVLLVIGHGHRQIDKAAAAGDALLGAVWVLFFWSVVGEIARVLLRVAGIDEPLRSRVISVTVALITAILLSWGHYQAMRVPRTRRVDVPIDRLGAALDGLQVVVITDTHYGPINRARWSAAVVGRVNKLGADIVCHVGDIADGTVDVRLDQAAPLAAVRAALARVYVTGNHEYLHEAQGWVDYMAGIGWDALHNRHIVVERDGDRLIIAGVDDATAKSSGVGGHGADLPAALAGADPRLPVLLLAHQPKQVLRARDLVDLQVSGHTHGGQIWPFHFLVRLEQPAVQGLRRFGDRTQLYTSRGTGFWGPPFRVFAPSEITLITLRAN